MKLGKFFTEKEFTKNQGLYCLTDLSLYERRNRKGKNQSCNGIDEKKRHKTYSTHGVRHKSEYNILVNGQPDSIDLPDYKNSKFDNTKKEFPRIKEEAFDNDMYHYDKEEFSHENSPIVNNSFFEQMSYSYMESIFSSPMESNVDLQIKHESHSNVLKIEDNWISRPTNYGPNKDLFRGILISPYLNRGPNVD